ncbi:cytochrome c oxidase subunit 4 [Microbacterium dauci]|uniref:Cytochrome c oxidase polypeptide 4 n=1 Tax=Microbacterium dauci TaxID=3048008 RepID=A0ABT6ZG93_9MICO|nr:cytochrome c oxidase subunit 4 [Microbacterium sp. LX3-4]MDJ1115169.1 cytochrome c oxidase subunit 4 [Microbacterium sp. LX3-4]
MKTNVNLWWILTAFFGLVAVVYTVWSILAHPSLVWYNAIEWVGSVALVFVTAMAAMIAFYTSRVERAQGGELPEDSLTADIDDGDPEMGEFSPWSWWPLVLAFSAALAFIGLAVGDWMVPIGFGVFAVAIIGWVYEYYRGYFAR